MGKLIFASLLAVFSFNALAEYGLKNFKEVMPGALYRGGGNGERVPMSKESLNALCEAGFSTAFYVYGKGGKETLNCGSNEITYYHTQWGKPREILSIIQKDIESGRGASYVHCWYGVHASGFIAAVALKQFCGYSSEEAVNYWNSHVPKKIQYPKVQEKIRAYQATADLQLSSGAQARFCP